MKTKKLTITIFLVFVFISCTKNNRETSIYTGIVSGAHSGCGNSSLGNPTYIIKLLNDKKVNSISGQEADSFYTTTLNPEFQINNLKIQFKVQDYPSDDSINTSLCLSDRIRIFKDIYNVSLFSEK
ncbi:MAG TPA: hypothetical protein PLJ42_04130 [Chitinophagales bacterium]|jgi:hypothetical protein|nr:hypothetical protein [Chitinophagales bacterium]MBP6153699.1 hypothetical protein [Chitinophagales bacterium]HQV77879.1 hypothetical protein [Chitinophagales bacterium]HQW78600.1 hypothetical protein [Chitinophagales bacterium]